MGQQVLAGPLAPVLLVTRLTDWLARSLRLTPTGVLTTLHSFNGADGADPAVGLTQGSDGKLYGEQPFQGGNLSLCNGTGCGAIFFNRPGWHASHSIQLLFSNELC